MLASHWQINPFALLGLIIGLGAVIGGACVFNNVLDEPIDARMERTKHRALPSGRVPAARALAYGAGLTGGGITILWCITTWLAAVVAAAGVIAYVLLYGYAKRTTPYGTIIGSLAGAVPPVAGYTAVTGQLDWVAASLFIILAVWQIPHFYAIAIFRLADYRAAGLPVWPVRYGVRATRRQIIGWIALFAAACWLLVWQGKVGPVYLGASLAVSAIWLWRAIQPAPADGVRWARRVFGWSLIVLLSWSLLIALPGV